ncbi:hypothetical protein IGI04_035393 [Brassica rapa subsp. trilocularis]|uniref:TPR1-like CTLH-containing domain-containing protein n=1 Tax=Brassica rapa subsp. trilocularis TaxID=1813537 RepID=A0ABQ7LEL7_BRACM|nr:hypothetical protein IGI04_035393 [Brassica rapa subsp. trilocularis]
MTTCVTRSPTLHSDVEEEGESKASFIIPLSRSSKGWSRNLGSFNILSTLRRKVFLGEEQLSKYGDTKSAMNMMYTKLKKLIDENLLFDEKLSFAIVKYSRLFYKVLNTRRKIPVIVHDEDEKL